MPDHFTDKPSLLLPTAGGSTSSSYAVECEDSREQSPSLTFAYHILPAANRRDAGIIKLPPQLNIPSLLKATRKRHVVPAIVAHHCLQQVPAMTWS